MEEPIKQWEQDVLNLALEHIKDSEVWSDSNYPEGGFHISPKPVEPNIDITEINHLFSDLEDEYYEYDGSTVLLLGDEDPEEDLNARLTGMININIFHSEIKRI
ncbi:hypothetical protein [Pedobacter rhodius]|uniref:Uncharacterized protein n=1 Tax=Pedobacter rhodius TaxID=3004098 RepID=A0ABT4L3E4_9SPHI|nr:hypothetical protein [Pedobacter sp. SJ11]MCZ4224942.1 hypothetical protein [Pedobacter sp. SJ11]